MENQEILESKQKLKSSVVLKLSLGMVLHPVMSKPENEYY